MQEGLGFIKENLVASYVEPISILGATVTAWAQEQPLCHARQAMAEILLLLI